MAKPSVHETMTDAKPRRRSKAEQRAETMEQILDAAEHLFAKSGLDGVTLKDIGRRAGVDASLLHYYFDDKRALFVEVFRRRAAITTELRGKALDRYEQDCAGAPTVDGALHAFLDTDLDLYIRKGEGWRNWGALGGQVSHTEWGAELLDDQFDPLVLRLIALLKQAMPDCPEEDIFWGYHFVSGALLLTLARTGRIDRLSNGLCKSDDFIAVKARMAQFMSYGFRSFCESRSRERQAIEQENLDD